MNAGASKERRLVNRLSLLGVGASAVAMDPSAAAAPTATEAVPAVLDPFLRHAENRVPKALARKREWDGPTTGPRAAKSDRMVATLRKCRQCEVLAVEDAALATLSERMPAITDALLSKHGARWTHSLAINDLYFDRLAETLPTRGVDPSKLVNVSAGDGSISAYQRIRAERWQVATVPEPLNLHGWQCVDELNRARAGERPSGYSSPVHFATIGTIVFDGGRNNQFDPDNGYRAAYRKVWGR